MKLTAKIIEKIEESVMSYSIIFMALLLILNIVMRKVFNTSLTFTEEISSALLIIVSFFGLGYTAKKGRHITMSIVFDMVDNRKKKIMMFIITSVSAIVMVYLAYLSFGYMMSTVKWDRVTPALQIPIYIIYAFVPVGLFLNAVEYVLTFFLNLKEKDQLYLTSEIHVPMDARLAGDLNTVIENAAEKRAEVLDTIIEENEEMDKIKVQAGGAD